MTSVICQNFLIPPLSEYLLNRIINNICHTVSNKNCETTYKNVYYAKQTLVNELHY